MTPKNIHDDAKINQQHQQSKTHQVRSDRVLWYIQISTSRKSTRSNEEGPRHASTCKGKQDSGQRQAHNCSVDVK